jgi:hypothetical protein
MKARWKLPSPTWPTSGASRPEDCDVGLHRGDAFGQPRDRHADVGRPALGARPERQRGIEGVVAGLPQPVAILGLGRPQELAGAEAAGDRRDLLGLLDDAPLGAVELEEEGRLLGIIELGIAVDRPHLDVVEQLDARHRDAELDRLDHRLDGAFDRREADTPPPTSPPARRRAAASPR